MKIDWEKINGQWGDILKAARKNEQMNQDLMFDDVGAIQTSGRPMIESLIADKAVKSHRVLFYLAMLGFHTAKGRIIALNAGSKMPMRMKGKQEKVKRKR